MKVKANYDLISTHYNQTRRADKYLAERLLSILNPKMSGLYLDIGCGTGNYTIELYKKGLELIGIDPSNEMLLKANEKNKEIKWRLGQAEKTDLDDESVFGVIAFLTIHHWTDLFKGMKEMYRVLKDESNIIIFTSTSMQMQKYWLNHYFPIMLKSSIKQMPTFESIKEAMAKAGLLLAEIEKYSIKPDLEDLFLYSGKHNPELYLRPEVRNGISSFSALANQAEVSFGLKKLKNDIRSGKINEIIKSYENEGGDYLFIKGKKLISNLNI